MIAELSALLRDVALAGASQLAAAPQIGFTPPDAQWRSYVDTAGVAAANFYLVDLRENRRLRRTSITTRYVSGQVTQLNSPDRVDCHYLLSAWSPAQSTSLQTSPTLQEQQLLYDLTVAMMDHAPLNPARFYAAFSPATTWPNLYAPYFASDMPTQVLPVEGFSKYAEFWGTMNQEPWRPCVYLIVTIPVISAAPDEWTYPVSNVQTTLGIKQPNQHAIQGSGRTNSIGGTVFDPQQRPVDGAVVSLHTLAGAALQRTTTGADGRFNFALVPEGEYIVQYASHRFSRQTATTIVPTVTGSYDLSFV